MCGQADADVGHDRLRLPGLLAHQVQGLRAVQDAQVRDLLHPVGEPSQQRAGEAFQRVVPQIRGAEFERGDAQAVALLLGEVGREASLGELRQQVVGR